MFSRLFGALRCRLGLHAWVKINDDLIPHAGEPDPERITDIHCARCFETRPCFWRLSESNGPALYTFPFRVSEKEALQFLRDHYAGASVDYIDRDWHVIFYRVPKKVV